MNQLTLNAAALSVFGMTLAVLMGPYLHLSPSLSAGIIFVGLSAVTFDAFRFQSLGLTLLLDTLAQLSPHYRQRVLHHEAGHFLIAYLLGLPIQSYTLSVWEAYRQGNPHQGGVVLEQPPEAALSDWMRLNIDRLCTVWVAGGVAEDLKYSFTEGNETDLRQLRQSLSYLGLNVKLYEAQAARRARQLLEENWQSYEALVLHMEMRQPTAECCTVIEQFKTS